MRYAFAASLAFLFLASAVAAEIKTFDVTPEAEDTDTERSRPAAFGESRSRTARSTSSTNGECTH